METRASCWTAQSGPSRLRAVAAKAPAHCVGIREIHPETERRCEPGSLRPAVEFQNRRPAALHLRCCDAAREMAAHAADSRPAQADPQCCGPWLSRWLRRNSAEAAH